MSAPIERTVRYATSVDTIQEAFGFVMDHLDRVGARPRVTINPISVYAFRDIGDDDAKPHVAYEAVVSGMTEEQS